MPVGRYELSVQGETLVPDIPWPFAACSAIARCSTPDPRVGPPSLRRCSAARPAWSTRSRPRRRRAPCCPRSGPVWPRSASSSRSGSGSALSSRMRSIGMAVLPPGRPARAHPPVGGRGEPATVSAIRVVAGMPPTYFGRAVAHEIGHAWLAQYGRSRVAPEARGRSLRAVRVRLAERERSPLADSLRSQLRANPDPVYGRGFRAVLAAVDRHGIDNVLTSLLTKGALP